VIFLVFVVIKFVALCFTNIANQEAISRCGMQRIRAGSYLWQLMNSTNSDKRLKSL
jgi:hypothetical protein